MTFIEFAESHGFDIPFIVDDNRIHRFDGPGEKRGRKSAWYVCNPTWGRVGDWRTGEKHPWTSQGRGAAKKLTKEENEEIARQAAQRFNEDEANKAKALRTAKWMWDNSGPAGFHSYLVQKKCGDHGIRKYKELLLVPVYAWSGGLISLQMIAPDGTKRFLKHSEVTGGHFLVGGRPHQGMVVCEGFATGATIHELTGKTVAIAFNSGNLNYVVQAFRPHRPIVAADNDYDTIIKGKYVNVGLDKGMEAAKRYNLDFTFPIMVECTDFNDLFKKAGKKECLKQLKTKVKL